MKFKKQYQWIAVLGFFFIILFGVFIRFERINGQTMEKSLMNEEFVIISKYKYGIRIPFINNLIFNTGKPDRGELLAFHYPLLQDIPVSKKPIIISRCVGLPGDTLRITEKHIFISKDTFIEPVNIQWKYRMFIDKNNFTHDFLAEHKINEGGRVNDVGLYDFPLTKSQFEKLKFDKRVSGLRVLKSKMNHRKQKIFPSSPYFAFTSDNFGPVVVPLKGWTIPINIRNIGLYDRIISQYEGNTLKTNYEQVFINGEEAFSYTFKKNYYFVLDDNRDFAEDSRHWGFLPEDHIIGETHQF